MPLNKKLQINFIGLDIADHEIEKIFLSQIVNCLLKCEMNNDHLCIYLFTLYKFVHLKNYHQ